MKEELNNYVEAYSPEIIYYYDEKIILNWYAKRVLDLESPKQKVLDLGLGHGITANLFSEYFNDYTVLDGSSEIIAKFRKDFPDSKAKIVETYFEKYDSKEKYDLIIMGFILEHVDFPVEIMKYYKKLLKKDGKIIATVPNAEAMNRRLGKYAGLLDELQELSEHDKAIGHKRYYTQQSFKNDINLAGLNFKDFEGIYLKPFTTKQILSLNFDDNIINALCQLGLNYPELSLALMTTMWCDND